MDFKNQLKEELKTKLSEKELKFLPSSYQRLGNVILLKIHSKLLKKDKLIGNAILNIYNHVKTVARYSSYFESISGIKRKPLVKIIAGKENKEVIHKEWNCKFKFDFTKIMFSKGNKWERGRIPKLIKDGEIVVDLFAGIGYFSIPIAKLSNAKKVYAIDINPLAIKYLKENRRINKIDKEKLEIIEGDCRRVTKSLENVADRVIMGYLFNTNNFLPVAFKVLKDEGKIHYHKITTDKGFQKIIETLVDEGEEFGYKLAKISNKRIIKSYSPSKSHIVIDAEFVRV